MPIHAFRALEPSRTRETGKTPRRILRTHGCIAESPRGEERSRFTEELARNDRDIEDRRSVSSGDGPRRGVDRDLDIVRPSDGRSPGRTRGCHVRSRRRCSVCSAIHTSSRGWPRSSSTREPSDPPLRVVFFDFRRRSEEFRRFKGKKKNEVKELSPGRSRERARRWRSMFSRLPAARLEPNRL